MKIGFLFVGQGAQIAGMGQDFYEQNANFKERYDQIKLDFDLKKISFTDQANLDQTEYAQAAIFAMSAAINDCFKANGIVPDMVAGLSLGEYSAYYAANSFDFETGVSITRNRGKIMGNALKPGTSGMAAILMLDEATLQSVCDEVQELGVCVIANYNAPGQLVLSGEIQALEKAMELSLAKGARKALRLAVSGAFHSPLLLEASKELEAILVEAKLKPTSIPLVSNCSGEVENTDPIQLLTKQIYSPVYFEKSIKTMIAVGIDTFIEIGPGKTCSAFVRKIDRTKTVYNVDTYAAFTQTLESLKGNNHE